MGIAGLGSRAIIGKFYETLEQSKDLAWPFKIGMEMPSDQESETYKWLGFSPMMREWVGGRHAKGLRENGITITNKKFESTVEFDVDDLRREKTGQVDVRIGEMADKVNAHWASLLSTLITGNGLCYDGQNFFDTDHSEGSSGTQVNACTSSHVPDLSVTDEEAPTAVEMAKAILGCVQYMYGYKDDQGEPMNENAKKFLILVPVNLWGPAVQAMASNLLSTGTGAIDNPLKLAAAGLDISVAVNPRFTETDVFYVLRTDGRAKPFILQNEEDVKMSVIGEGSELEFNDNVHRYGVKALRNVGFGYWQQALKATLSS